MFPLEGNTIHIVYNPHQIEKCKQGSATSQLFVITGSVKFEAKLLAAHFVHFLFNSKPIYLNITSLMFTWIFSCTCTFLVQFQADQEKSPLASFSWDQKSLLRWSPANPVVNQKANHYKLCDRKEEAWDIYLALGVATSPGSVDENKKERKEDAAEKEEDGVEL